MSITDNAAEVGFLDMPCSPQETDRALAVAAAREEVLKGASGVPVESQRAMARQLLRALSLTQ